MKFKDLPDLRFFITQARELEVGPVPEGFDDRAKYWVQPLWHVDYWDGPRDGVCEVAGERLWFTSLIHERTAWLYAVVRAPVMVEAAVQSLEDFGASVGTHTEYAWDAELEKYFRTGQVHSLDRSGFYERSKWWVRPALQGDEEVVGWFAW